MSDNNVTVSFIGRTRRAKGVEMFIALAKRLPHENVRFFMTGQRVGRPTPDSYSQEEINRLVAQDQRIHYLGYREDIENIYASSDIIVMPSQVDEPCAAVLIEAGACGKPVVATNRGSNAEFLSHGENGFLVESNDLAGMTHYVNMLVLNKKLRNSMGNKARNTAEQRFAREPITEVEKIYSSLTR